MRVTTGRDVAPRTEKRAAGGGAWTVCAGIAAGALGAFVFQQGTLFLLHHLGRSFPVVLVVFGQVPPPHGLASASIVAAIEGGVWGAVLAVVLRRPGGLPDLLFGFLFGALAMTLVDVTLAAALNGLPLSADGDRRAWLSTGLANGAWGWGTALLLLLIRLPRRD